MKRCTVCRRPGHTARKHSGLSPEALAALREDGLEYLGRGFRELGEPHPNGDLLNQLQASVERAMIRAPRDNVAQEALREVARLREARPNAMTGIQCDCPLDGGTWHPLGAPGCAGVPHPAESEYRRVEDVQLPPFEPSGLDEFATELQRLNPGAQVGVDDRVVVLGPVVSATPDENPQPDDVGSVTPPDDLPGCDVGDAPDVMGDTGVIYICSACGTPTESEPCAEHQPAAYARRDDDLTGGTLYDTPDVQDVPVFSAGFREGSGLDATDTGCLSPEKCFGCFGPCDLAHRRQTPRLQGPMIVPWRTWRGPDEPIRVTLPGVYTLTADEYHNPAITGDWISNSDVKKLMKDCPAQFEHDRWHGVRKVSDAFDFGHVAHTRVLGRGEQFRVFEPKKLDGRTKEGKAQAAAVEQARAAGFTPIYGDTWALITAMVDAIEAHPFAAQLLRQPGRPEVCLFWHEWVKITDPKNTLYGQLVRVQRRAMVDYLPTIPDDPEKHVVVVDYKTADEINPDDGMRKRIYDYGYHRQADTIRAGIRALFDRDAEVLFLMQCKRPPHLVTPVDLDTPAQLVAQAQNYQVLQVWAECVATGVWPEYTKGIATSGVPAWIERLYEEEMVIR